MGRKCTAVMDSAAQVTVINKECMKGVAKDNLLLAEVVDDVVIEAPNNTAYKRWSCHIGPKLLCKLC